jgi:hypothetical protein
LDWLKKGDLEGRKTPSGASCRLGVGFWEENLHVVFGSRKLLVLIGTAFRIGEGSF